MNSGKVTGIDDVSECHSVVNNLIGDATYAKTRVAASHLSPNLDSPRIVAEGLTTVGVIDDTPSLAGAQYLLQSPGRQFCLEAHGLQQPKRYVQ